MKRSHDENLKDTSDADRSKLGNGASNDEKLGVRPQDCEGRSESIVTKSETIQGS